MKFISVWAVTMVRNEQDIIRQSICNMIDQGVDGLIVADNESDDRTPKILESLQHLARIPLVILTDTEVAYHQSQKMTRLGSHAHGLGAQWIIPFDADELWNAGNARVADIVRGHAEDIDVILCPFFNYVPTLMDEPSDDPLARLRWREKNQHYLQKVIYRYNSDITVDQGNHSCSSGRELKTAPGGHPIRIRHYPWRSFEQFKLKVKMAQQAHDFPDISIGHGAHWRPYAKIMIEEGERGMRKAWDDEIVAKSPEKLIEDPYYRP